MHTTANRMRVTLSLLALSFAGVQIVTDHWLGDQPYLLYVASQMLHGVQLDGSSLTETNPPLAVWLSIPAAWLSNVSHQSAGAMMRTLTIILIGLTSTWCAGMAGRGREKNAIAWDLLFSVAFVELLVLPVFFAQREHLLVILLMPWLFVCIHDQDESIYGVERVVAGVCAAVAFCLKPQQLGILPLVLLYRFLVARSHRTLLTTDILIVLSAGFLYLAIVYTCTPYFQVIYPLLRDTYWALGPYTATQMLAQMWPAEALLAATGFAIYLAGTTRNKSAVVFSLATVGACLAALMQGTGWRYQQLPIYLFGAMSLIMAGISLKASRWRTDWWGKWLLSTLGIAVLCSCVGLAVIEVRQRHPHSSQAVEVLAELPAGTTVGALSTQQTFFDTVLQRKLKWASRFGHLWMLPAILDNDLGTQPFNRSRKALDPSRVASLAVYTRAAVAEDLTLRKPAVVLVQQCGGLGGCAFLSRPTDLIAWFSEDPSFREVWRGYRLIAVDREYAAYSAADYPLARCVGRSDQYGCPSFIHGR